MSINWVDILIMIIILLNVMVGIRSGIIRGVINFIGIITAILLAIFWFREVGEFIDLRTALSREISNVVGFMLIFLGVCLIARMIEIFLKKVFSLLFISWIDVLGGALLGFVRGSIMVGILLIITTFVPLPIAIKNQFENSFLANRFAVMTMTIYVYIRDWLPENFQFDTEEFLKKFDLNLLVLKNITKSLSTYKFL